jgi:hypothetical protein
MNVACLVAFIMFAVEVYLKGNYSHMTVLARNNFGTLQAKA